MRLLCPCAVLCEVIGEPIKRLAYLIGGPIKLTSKRALRNALPMRCAPRRLIAVAGENPAMAQVWDLQVRDANAGGL